MTLQRACKDAFKSLDRARGNSRETQERIEIRQIGKLGVLAIAEGSYDNQYLIGLDFADLDENVLGVHCDCSRYHRGYYCKHLWATIKKLESSLGSSIGSRQLELYDVDPAEIAIGATVQHTQTDNARNQQKQRRIDSPTASKKKNASWKSALQQIGAASADPHGIAQHHVFRNTFVDSQHWFVVSIGDYENTKDFNVSIMGSGRKQDRQWSRPVAVELDTEMIAQLPCDLERNALSLLSPVQEHRGHYTSYYSERATRLFSVEPSLLAETVDAMFATGRLAWKLGDSRQHFEDAQTISQVNTADVHHLTLNLEAFPGMASQLTLRASLDAAQSSFDINQIMWLSNTGCALIQLNKASDQPTHGTILDQVLGGEEFETALIRVAPNCVSMIRAWHSQETITIPKRSLTSVINELADSHASVPLRVDPELGVDRQQGVPSATCFLQQQERFASKYDATMTAVYNDVPIDFDSDQLWWFDKASKTIIDRDRHAEAMFIEAIPEGEFDIQLDQADLSLEVAPEAFIQIVNSLQSAGWEVVANGAPIRIASDFNIEVESGVDWFDLNAEVQFGEERASLPELLRALKRGDKTVLLDDGTQGMLPEQWLNQFVDLGKAGEEVDDALRFRRNQGLLLDLMLQEAGDVKRDRNFNRFLKKLRAFEGVKPQDPPKSFQGELREYQQTGLGWFQFLQEFGFGGCLADDMGLGKTIQVLALMDKRRTRRIPKDETRKPSIVVVPKSLIFNWIDEASKFTPKLRIMNYTGTGRKQLLQEAVEKRHAPHVIVTTYGTLRNDAPILRETEFDYVILDEAQAIKNPKSQAAKACRLMQGEHRLAMTGTPVENHLGDLWSLFEFLNPGMLSSGFTGGGAKIAKLDDKDNRERVDKISQSLRPFILRRTKSQVLTELPEKVEQTLACEMGTKQRKLYDELREHYRLHLSSKVQELGIKRSKIHVLEALLRLRQAACDPRLVKPDCEVRGAKIETLMQQLSEVIGKGHKALVFSQFTTLLGLLREDIDQEGWKYEYLDGKTRKRADRVQRFQNDEECKLFLISLKAGGNGLNLTAADYVFILDPWWNPAVEAQAIDRAHRMGQTKSVNAYRMVCSETVEQKIIELQQSKRDLADAIISQEKSLIGDLTAEDIEKLLA